MRIELLLQNELNEWHKMGRFVVDSVNQCSDDPEWYYALVFQDGKEFGIEFNFEILQNGNLDMSEFLYEIEGAS